MATPPQLLPQQRHFYSGRWTKSHDASFIDALCWKAEKRFKQDDPHRPNKMALLFAGRATILENPAFQWDMEKNILHALYDAWVALIKEIPFADAYIKRGEPKWKSLKLIFESNEEGRRGHGHEIVSISCWESDDNSYDDEDDSASFREELKPDLDSVIDLAISDSD
ncbi:hypothetical protein Salat_2773400 [Sesamum alatum]|uniref:Uncharacterized protein n=1 Tax=Sesamum alatum TaxID=300844 RepID=A0AAE1XLH0_9LAMI|nr:hypothetical protein Salat_2773400 [Sesamum alatum]